MDNSKLARFRAAVVGCFRAARGALSDLCDALATDGDAQSLPELSESPFFRRKWQSIYKALSRGVLADNPIRVPSRCPSVGMVEPAEDWCGAHGARRVAGRDRRVGDALA